MFFDMRLYRQKILVDELGGLFVVVRLGIQPSTGSSGRRRTEIQQEGTGLFFRYEQTLIYIPAPLNSHLPSFVLSRVRYRWAVLGWCDGVQFWITAP